MNAGSPRTEAEYHQFGQNTAHACRATFLALLAGSTEDPRLIAAAERGRREALEETEAAA